MRDRMRGALLLGAALVVSAAGHAQTGAGGLRDPAIDAPAAAHSDAAPAPADSGDSAGETSYGPLIDPAPDSTAESTAESSPTADAAPNEARIAPAPVLPSLIIDDPLAEAEAIVNQFHEALRSGSRAGVLATLGAEVKIYNGGRAAHTRRDYEASMLDADLLDGQSAQRQLQRREVLGVDDTVWILSEWRVQRMLAGAEVLFDEAETMMLRRQSDAWMIQHRHLSARPVTP